MKTNNLSCYSICMYAQYGFTKTGKSSSGGVVVSLAKVLQTMNCMFSVNASNAAGLTSQTVSSDPIQVNLERMAPQAIKWAGSPENTSVAYSSNVKSHCVSWEPFVPTGISFDYSLALAPANTTTPTWVNHSDRFHDYEKKDGSRYFYACLEKDLSPGTYAVFVKATNVETQESVFGRSNRVVVNSNPPVFKSMHLHRHTPEAVLLEGDVMDEVSDLEDSERYDLMLVGYSGSAKKRVSGSAVNPKFVSLKSKDGVAQIPDLTKKATALGVQIGTMVPVFRAQNGMSQGLETVLYKQPIVIDSSGPGEGFLDGVWAASRPILHSSKCGELDLQINGLHDPESHVNEVEILVGKDEDDHSYHKSTLNKWTSSMNVKLAISNLPTNSKEELAFVTIKGSTPNGHATKFMQKVMIDCLAPRVPATGNAVVAKDPNNEDTTVLEVAWEHAGDKSLNAAATSLSVLCGENNPNVTVHPRSTKYVSVTADGSGTAAIAGLNLPLKGKCLVKVHFEDDGGQSSSLDIGFSVDFVKPDVTSAKIKFGDSLFVNTYDGIKEHRWPSATELHGSFGPLPMDDNSLDRYECALRSEVSLKEVATVSNTLKVDDASKEQSFVFAGLDLVDGQSYAVTCTVLDNNDNGAEIVSESFAIDSIPPTPAEKSLNAAEALNVRSYIDNNAPCIEVSWLPFVSHGLGPKHYRACVQWQSGSDNKPECSPNIDHKKGDQALHVTYKACTTVDNILKNKDVLVKVTAYDHFNRNATLDRSLGLASQLSRVVMPSAVWDASRTAAFVASRATSYRVNWAPLNANALSRVQQECQMKMYKCGANRCADVSKLQAVATRKITKSDLQIGYVIDTTAALVDGGVYQGCLTCENLQKRTVCTQGIAVHHKPPHAGKLKLQVKSIGHKGTATLRVITPPSDSGSGLQSATIVVSNVFTFGVVARIPLATNTKKNTDVLVPVNNFGAGTYSFKIYAVNELGMQNRSDATDTLKVDATPPIMSEVHLGTAVEKDGRIRLSVSCYLCGDPESGLETLTWGVGSAPGRSDLYGPIAVGNAPKQLIFNFVEYVALAKAAVKAGALFATVNTTNKAQMTNSKR